MWADIYSVIFFSYGHSCWTRQAIANGFPAYEYWFSKENGRLGPWPSGEEIYCYDNIPADSPLFDDSDYALADLFSDYFAAFITDGNPNRDGLPVWEQSRTGDELMELGERQGMISDPYRPLHEILDRMNGWE